jgi:type I restriction enzyme S subunit
MRNGWIDTTLGDICDVRDGTHDSPKQSEIGYPLVTSKNIRDGKVDLSDVYLISDSDFHEINRRSKVNQFDLLVSMIGTVGEVCFEPNQPSYAIKNVGLIKTGNELLGRFLVGYLSSRMGQEQIELATSGSTQKFIGLGKLRSLRVLLPPLAEQKRIVDVVSSVDAYIDALQQQADTARTARNAVLHELLSAGGDEWTETTLGDIAELAIGRTPSRSESRYWTEDLTNPFCTIADMDGKWITPLREGVTDAAIQEGKARLVAAGSLLMSFKLTLGRVGFAGVDLYPNEAIVAIEVEPSRGSSEYLYLVLGFQDLSHGSGRAIKGVTLNSKSLAAIPLALPPLDEQKRIVEIVSSMDDVIQSTEQAVVDAKNLRSSLLSDLLSGEHEIPASYDVFMGAA